VLWHLVAEGLSQEMIFDAEIQRHQHDINTCSSSENVGEHDTAGRTQIMALSSRSGC
jgi:hypothetical protein